LSNVKGAEDRQSGTQWNWPGGGSSKSRLGQHLAHSARKI
jgi:hypothetical protein